MNNEHSINSLHNHLVKICKVIRTTQIRHPAVVVVTEVSGTTRTDRAYIVNPLLCTIVPVQFPRHKRTCSTMVSLIESLRTEVVMFPAAKDILGDGVEVVTPMLVTIIVVVTAGEAVHRVVGREAFAVVTVSAALVASLMSGLTDVALDHVLPLQLAHVVDHLVVKVRVVKSFIDCSSSSSSCRPVPRVLGGNRHGPVPEWCGRVAGEEGIGEAGRGGNGRGSGIAGCIQLWDMSWYGR